jgi:hypothetical protein
MLKKRFNWRAFNSLYIIYSFVIMSLSGAILFIAPPGRIANWTDLSILGFTKHEWQAIHTIFTFFFIISIAFHIYFNWKPILFYIRTRINKRNKIKIELYAASFFTLIVIILTYFELPPAGTIIDIGETLTNSWNDPGKSALASHAELLTIDELCVQYNLSSEQSYIKLQKAGIIISNKHSSIKTIGQKNNISTDQLFEIVTSGIKQKLTGTNRRTGKGLGRKTLQQISMENNISIDVLLSKLRQRGIDANPQSTIKEIANSHNLYPYTLLEQLDIKH